jgi:hypothetical protein
VARKNILRKENETMKTDEAIDNISELFVRAYEQNPNNPSVYIDADDMKKPGVSDQISEWRARKMIVPFAGAPTIFQCTGDGYLFLRDRVTARRAIP